MKNFKKYTLLLFILSLFCLEAKAQCVDESNFWIESWTSCEVSANPNPLRGNTAWMLLDFAEQQAISTTHIWNANRASESGKGAKTVFMDISTDGINWMPVDSDPLIWPQATELDGYEGFPGPDLSAFGFIEKVLFTFVDNHESSLCISVAELRFDIDTLACYGTIDECGICNGLGLQTYYEDADDDGLGNPSVSVEACEPPVGYVDNSDDNCDNGLIGWDKVEPLFSENGCTGCHNGPGGSGGLDLTSYNGISQGGNLCGVNILTETTLVDIININEYDGCTSPIPFPSMNERVGNAMDPSEIQLIQTWIDDGALENCNCPIGSPDSDGDGVCDDSDLCNGLDDALIGTSCDDGNPCTIQDMITIDCECVGLPGPDTDFDGVCDLEDLAPNDPCTADGILGMPEPTDWFANLSNDCDVDGASVAIGDLNDYDECINHQGSSLDPECACAGTFEIGGGALVTSVGIGNSFRAEGKPNGVFTNNIGSNDYLEMSFPYMEIGTEICFTVGFNSTDGAQFEVNDLGIYKFLNPDPTLTNYEPQIVCFPTFMSGTQKIRISRLISGTFRVDGSTFNYCPCTESDPGKDFISCDCPDDFTEEAGTYLESFGISNPELSDGAADGQFTGAISGSDSLILTYPNLSENYQICLDVQFSSIDGRMSLDINGENSIFPNLTNSTAVQQVCFFTNSSDSHTVIVKDGGSGNIKVDGSNSGHCNPCLVDVDLDGVCDDVDICLSGDDLLDQDGDGIPDACDTCDGNLVGLTCDDNDNCTYNDIYDANCNCIGTTLLYKLVDSLQGSLTLYTVDSITLTGNFDILSNGYFQAGKSVTITPGFETSILTKLDIQIGDCESED